MHLSGLEAKITRSSTQPTYLSYEITIFMHNTDTGIRLQLSERLHWKLVWLTCKIASARVCTRVCSKTAVQVARVVTYVWLFKWRVPIIHNCRRDKFGKALYWCRYSCASIINVWRWNCFRTIRYRSNSNLEWYSL